MLKKALSRLGPDDKLMLHYDQETAGVVPACFSTGTRCHLYCTKRGCYLIHSLIGCASARGLC